MVTPDRSLENWDSRPAAVPGIIGLLLEVDGHLIDRARELAARTRVIIGYRGFRIYAYTGRLISREYRKLQRDLAPTAPCRCASHRE